MSDSLTTTATNLGLPQPSISSTGRVRPRVLVATFGGGYEQRSQDGPNSGLAEWNVTWNNITPAQLIGLANFFKAHGGTAKFTWTQPPPFNVDGVKWWIAEEWSWVYSGGTINGITVPLLERPPV